MKCLHFLICYSQGCPEFVLQGWGDVGWDIEGCERNKDFFKAKNLMG
jgi:hypothetical protein